MSDKPSRLRRAREMAGLSRAQAARQLGWLCLYEDETEPQPNDAQLGVLAALYGVQFAWLRGADLVLRPEVEALLRSIENIDDRAKLTELLIATQGVPR